jgi:hypothetical protein
MSAPRPTNSTTQEIIAMKRLFSMFVVLSMLALGGASTAVATQRDYSAAHISRARPALTESGAKSYTYKYAKEIWGYEAVGYPYRCNGPYENGYGVTQWACYGELPESANVWQVNVDAYGNLTYYQRLP